MSAWSASPVLAPSSLPSPRSSRRISRRSSRSNSRGAYGELGGFRDEYPGGVIHLFRYLVGHFSAMHQHKGPPPPSPPPQAGEGWEGAAERERFWRDAMNNPDYKMYPHVYNLIAQKGQHMPPYYNVLVDPFDNEAAVRKSEAEFAAIKVPTYTGSGWYGYTYKTHLNGCQHWYSNIAAPKKLLLAGPAHLERPFHSFHGEVLRWHDHWLKGLDTGVMDEPPVKFWVMGANAWRTASDWPLPETQWTRLYLTSWERLTPEQPAPSSATATQPPDSFVQMPPSQTTTIQRLRYMTDPLPHDVLVAGPIVVTLYAAIDQDDTNWIVILKDVGPDVSVMSVREGEREVPKTLHEREISRGWLKASHRAIDPQRSKPYWPWHPLTREAQKPVTPGTIEEYQIEVMATANLFRQGHRICLDVTSLDLPTGVAGATNAEYVPYHICSSKTVLHTVYHDRKYPSHVLLPIIPE